MKPYGTFRLLIAGLILSLALALAPAAFAQGCAMCRENAAATADGGRTINLAILVLLVPTLVFFIGIVVFSLRRADAEAAPEEQASPTETIPQTKWFARAALLLRPHTPSKN